MNQFKKWIVSILAVLMLELPIVGSTTVNAQKTTGKTVTVTYVLQRNSKQFVRKKVYVKQGADVLTGLKHAWHVRVKKGMVTAIDGRSQNTAKKTYWMYKVDGKEATKGVTQEKVQNHDTVTFNLERVNE